MQQLRCWDIIATEIGRHKDKWQRTQTEDQASEAVELSVVERLIVHLIRT